MGAFLPPAFPKTGNIPPGMTAGRDIFMATYTSNYQLHQWVPEDDFLRTDFNTDFQKIDAALAALRTLANGKASASAVSSLQSQMASKAEVVTGAYTGNGSTQTITLGFKPRAVVFYLKETESGVIFPGLESSIAAVTASGFTVTINTGYAYDTNKNGRAYAYLALK